MGKTETAVSEASASYMQAAALCTLAVSVLVFSICITRYIYNFVYDS